MTAACWLFTLSSALPYLQEAQARGVETIQLNIDDRRVSREYLENGIALEIGGPDAGVDLSVGAALTASRLDVRLRGIYGIVRYRLDGRKVLDSVRALAR